MDNRAIRQSGWTVAALATLLAAMSVTSLSAQRSREEWVALAKGGFVVPTDRHAVDMLMEMNDLLFSTDPVLRDEVAYSAAERWILRD
jgi:hypothetical protein